MKILIAVIAYNEEENVEFVYNDLMEFKKVCNYPYDVVLIDNGSIDSTVKKAKNISMEVVEHCINTGGSGGTDTSYFTYAFLKNYDVLIQFDGDRQHVAKELPKIIEPILAGKGDYVIGSRYLTGDGFQSTAIRRLGINLFNFLINKFSGLKITDCTSGFRSYNRKVIEFFGKRYKHELFDPMQILLLAHFAGAKVIETPVVMKERTHGVSEFNFISSITFVLRGVVSVVGVYLQRANLKD